MKTVEKAPPSGCRCRRPTYLGVPYRMDIWKDQDVNNRATLSILLPLVPLKYVELKVAKGGHAVTLKVQWPRNLLEPERINSTFKNADGLPAYLPWHPKNVAGKEAIRELRHYSTENVFSAQDFLLPFKCEEHFTDFEGRPGLKFVKFKSGESYALLELMGVRDNYEDAKKASKYEFAEFEDDESTTAMSTDQSLPSTRSKQGHYGGARGNHTTAATTRATATTPNVRTSTATARASATMGTSACVPVAVVKAGYDPGSVASSNKRRAFVQNAPPEYEEYDEESL